MMMIIGRVIGSATMLHTSHLVVCYVLIYGNNNRARIPCVRATPSSSQTMPTIYEMPSINAWCECEYMCDMLANTSWLAQIPSNFNRLQPQEGKHALQEL